jgi:hypothetical protein
MGALSSKAIKKNRLLAPGAAIALICVLAALQMPVANTLWRQSLGISGVIHTGNWPSATPTATLTSTSSPTPTSSPSPTPHSGCKLRGTLTVTPFFEYGHYGIDVKLCLYNPGTNRVHLTQITNTIQGSSMGGNFIDLGSEDLDLSQRSSLDLGEIFCYTAHIILTPLTDGRYRDELHVFALDEMDHNKMSAAAEPDATEVPAVMDFSVDFTLPTPADPSITPSAAPTVTGTIFSLPTAAPTGTPPAATPRTQMPTAAPTITPMVSSTSIHLPTVASTETPIATQTEAPSPLPSSTSSPTLTATPLAPTDTQTPTDTDVPTQAPTPTKTEAADSGGTANITPN